MVALALVSNEKGETIARAVRLFLCWLVRLFPELTQDLTHVHIPNGGGEMVDDPYEGDDYDPAVQEMDISELEEEEEHALDTNGFVCRNGEGLFACVS